jgi:anti-anti-sigma factor
MPCTDHELEPFRCEIEPDRIAVRVRPVGELDLATVPIVEAQLAELWSVGFTHLVLDLRDVVFLDSAGVRLLVSWHAHSSADGIVFGVIPGPPPVQQVLEITGVADHLTYWSPNGSGPVAVSGEASAPAPDTS